MLEAKRSAMSADAMLMESDKQQYEADKEQYEADKQQYEADKQQYATPDAISDVGDGAAAAAATAKPLMTQAINMPAGEVPQQQTVC